MHFRPRCVVWFCLRVSFGWIACKWLFGLCGIAWKNITERGRGGACVPARVALQWRIHHSPPVHNAYIFGMETPLCGRLGGHTGTAPTVSFGRIARGWFCLFVGKTVHMNQHHRCCTFVSPGLIERSEIYPG